MADETVAINRQLLVVNRHAGADLQRRVVVDNRIATIHAQRLTKRVVADDAQYALVNERRSLVRVIAAQGERASADLDQIQAGVG